MFINCGFISYAPLLLFFTLCLNFILLFLCFFKKYLWFYVGHVRDDVFLIIIVYILFTVLLVFHTPKEGTY